jgi:hypothetical protein
LGFDFRSLAFAINSEFVLWTVRDCGQSTDLAEYIDCRLLWGIGRLRRQTQFDFRMTPKSRSKVLFNNRCLSGGNSFRGPQRRHLGIATNNKKTIHLQQVATRR